MSEPTEIDPLILDRYLADTANADEADQVRRWQAASPRNRATLEALAGWFGQSGPVPESSSDVAWRSLQDRMSAAVENARGRKEVADKRPKQLSVQHIWRVAAALMISIGGGTVWRATTADTVISAPSGQRLSTVLPDGSQMTLAAGGEARWSRRFGSGTRELHLTGEATFDVVHDTTQPFRVLVGDNIAEDVGTKFVVRAWPEVNGVEVSVDEGAVALSRDRRNATLLNAGDRGRISTDGRVEVTRDGSARFAWARGEFVFDNTTLAEALPALARWYGVNITATPAMSERRVNGRFNLLPLDPLLESLALALDARVVRNGSQINLLPR
ncbi:MAG: FecR family protein [Gemmatimonas sp.]